MKVTVMEKLDSILDEHYECTKESAKKILEELKTGSANYGDLKKSIEIYKKTVFFHQTEVTKNEAVFIEIYKLLEKEMNDLPLTNRSEQ